jgi:hypothetical protein
MASTTTTTFNVGMTCEGKYKTNNPTPRMAHQQQQQQAAIFIQSLPPFHPQAAPMP